MPGQGISVSSQRNFSNSFIVDGLSANDDAAGLVQAGFGMDVISEMQVVTNGGQAEFGRALGGYINFISRSGSNDLHGGAYGYLRNQRLNAANALSGTNLPLTQGQYGAIARRSSGTQTARSSSATSSSASSIPERRHHHHLRKRRSHQRRPRQKPSAIRATAAPSAPYTAHYDLSQPGRLHKLLLQAGSPHQ